MKSKQEVIQQHYEQAGLVWNEINSMVNMNDGTITLKDPILKHTLTGYENAVFKKLLNPIVLTDKGLWLELVSLGNMDYNNGWFRLESKSDLPSDFGNKLYEAGYLDDQYGFHEMNKYYLGFQLKKDFERGIITHFRVKQDRKPPIY